MRWGLVATVFASLVAFEASAGSVLIYDGQGKLDRVVRPSPSGFVVYDGRGTIVSAVRNVGFDRRAIIDIDVGANVSLGPNEAQIAIRDTGPVEPLDRVACSS